MSLECRECENDVRRGHPETCSQHPLRKALLRVKDRAQRVVDGRLECSAFSVADYDLQVVTDALAHVDRTATEARFQDV
jgi:hypothetical protein